MLLRLLQPLPSLRACRENNVTTATLDGMEECCPATELALMLCRAVLPNLFRRLLPAGPRKPQGCADRGVGKHGQALEDKSTKLDRVPHVRLRRHVHLPISTFHTQATSTLHEEGAAPFTQAETALCTSEHGMQSIPTALGTLQLQFSHAVCTSPYF